MGSLEKKGMGSLEQKGLNIFERHVRIVVALAAVCGSSSGILARLITAEPLAIGFYRLTFALPFFAVPVLLHHREELMATDRKQLLACAISGFFLFFHFFCWFKAAQTTTIASAIVLASLQPVAALLITIFIFKNKVSAKAIAGICTAIIGGTIIAGFDYSAGSHTFSGDIYALISGFLLSFYFCMGGVIRKRLSASIYVLLVFFFAWCFFIMGMIATGTRFTGYPATDYIFLITMALVCQICCHAVYNWAVGYVGSLYIATWSTSDIFFAVFLAFLILNEIPAAHQFVGGIIVFSGLLYYNRHELDGQEGS